MAHFLLVMLVMILWIIWLNAPSSEKGLYQYQKPLSDDEIEAIKAEADAAWKRMVK